MKNAWKFIMYVPATALRWGCFIPASALVVLGEWAAEKCVPWERARAIKKAAKEGWYSSKKR